MQHIFSSFTNINPHCLYHANIRSKVSQNLPKAMVSKTNFSYWLFLKTNPETSYIGTKQYQYVKHSIRIRFDKQLFPMQTICISETCMGVGISDMSQYKPYNSEDACKLLFYSCSTFTGSFVHRCILQL